MNDHSCALGHVFMFRVKWDFLNDNVITIEIMNENVIPQ